MLKSDDVLSAGRARGALLSQDFEWIDIWLILPVAYACLKD